MQVIKERYGKTDQRGITIHILKQKSKVKSRTITVRGITVEEAYNKIRSYFQLIENNPKEVVITWKTMKLRDGQRRPTRASKPTATSTTKLSSSRRKR